MQLGSRRPVVFDIAPATFVENGYGSAGSPTTIALPKFAAVAGSTIVVFFRSSNVSAISSMTDTAGNTYTEVVANTTQDPRMRIWHTQSGLANANNIITLVYGGSDFVWACALQYLTFGSSLTSGSKADATGGTTDLTTSSISTASRGILLVAWSQNTNAAYTAGADFTLIDGTLGDVPTAFFFGAVQQYQTYGALSSYTAHITSTKTNRWTTVWVAYALA